MTELSPVMPSNHEPSQDAARRSEPHPGTTLERIFEVFARDAACHMTGGPATEQDLRGLEKAVGRPLPASFRAFLARFGGGLVYQGHEIFGPHRVMIHDIELVPSLTSMLAWLRSQQPAVPDGVLPFHRSGGSSTCWTFGTPRIPSASSRCPTARPTPISQRSSGRSSCRPKPRLTSDGSNRCSPGAAGIA